MKQSGSDDGRSASELIDQRIAELADWRGKALRTMRDLIRQANPGVVEEWKWMGTPVWSHGFEAVAMQEDFGLLRDMLDERAYFRFNDGDFVGREAVQVAFEKTWRADPTVMKASFYRSDIVVLGTDHASATATCTCHCEASHAGRGFNAQGRGTRVLLHENGRFRIVHEHLSRFPTLPR